VTVAVLRGFFTSLFAIAVALVIASPSSAARPRVLAVELDNDINPVTADYVNEEISRAERDGFDAVAILLDTPGGLSESMRKIVKAELASKVPVIVYVSPNGARAASAGVWIGEAADVLAMAPQTNIGSSTPISIGGENIQRDLRRKVVNDAAASLRALSRSHGRNVAWADAAVRKASNLTAYEALQRHVIDIVAPTLPVLLDRIDGWTSRGTKHLVLHTAGADVTEVHMSLWKRILDTLIDPNIITLMLSLGALGIIVELYHPGLIFPATFGGICLIIAFYGLQVLPVNWAGLLLMLLAAGFWGAEPFVMSHGALALAGTAAFIFGALLLFDPAGSAYQVSVPVVLGIAFVITLLLLFMVVKVLQVRRRPPMVGSNNLTGKTGIVRRGGLVSVKGELWQARSADGEPLMTGESVVIEDVERLQLVVRHPHDPAHA
jgi:membrane-bound serine protease (ClpP class)